MISLLRGVRLISTCLPDSSATSLKTVIITIKNLAGRVDNLIRIDYIDRFSYSLCDPICLRKDLLLSNSKLRVYKEVSFFVVLIQYVHR